MALSDSSSPVNGRLKVLTFGAGAIGTYIGGSLALAGHPVVFVEQPKVVEELREKGMRLDLTLDSRRRTKDASLLDSSDFVIVSSLEEALRYGPFDLALFALKSFDTQTALDGIKPFADKIPPTVLPTNPRSWKPWAKRRLFTAL
jgi:2-dehydropantoate 2-reductase